MKELAKSASVLLAFLLLVQTYGYRWRTSSLPGEHGPFHYAENYLNLSNSWSDHSEIYSRHAYDIDFTPSIYTNASGQTCSGSNPSLGTCGVKDWADNNEPNYQLCTTNWINKQGKTTIPSCGATSQICMTVGIQRTTAGKPISCKVASNPTSQGRNWFVEVGDGSECMVACFDSSSMGNYTVIGEFYNSDGPSQAPWCVPDNVYLDGDESHCMTARNWNLSAWEVQAQPAYTSSQCSGRCYSGKPSYMYGIETFRSPRKLPDAYPICYLSSTHQDNNSQIGSCQVSMIKNNWWFKQDGNGVHCNVACSCRNSGFPYCKKLDDAW